MFRESETIKIFDENLSSFVGIEIREGILALYVCGTKINSFEGLRLPNSLIRFTCDNNKIESFHVEKTKYILLMD